MEEDIGVVVIDNGSGVCKAGLSSSEGPSVLFPSMVGRPRNTDITSQKDFYVGDEAQSNRDILNLTYPIEHGIITNWDDMEKIWSHIFYNALKTKPEEHSVFLTQIVNSPESINARMSGYMFETLSVPALYISSTPVLSLYASGQTSGLVIESGYGVSHTVPIYEGSLIAKGVKRLNLAGDGLTEYMKKLLEDRDITLDMDTALDIKEKFAYISLDNNESDKQNDHSSYELPDGQVITIGEERYRCPEGIFQPSLLGDESDAGIHQMAHSSLMECDVDICRDLSSKVVLSGGSTLFPGFSERISKELKTLCPSTMEINIFAPPERKNSAWIGGSVMSSLSSFGQLCVTKVEFEEIGPSIIKKTFT
ncbi:hypothetical protein PPL_01284 [Heterostelium album PN500]|uniref:Actin n=1 Tax=Heterostelium pallidum (strain ATCC 26659 / Pp 5 / PN500) TaxID=670386 RepID=D3AYM2_HETP5|nr:hypothetical protein PPL_01284 [Heterostelium album PN500]EFA86049.1 hypothetical protein PPL_01284 [Heterostelium album PN500]|eukprot:XP_020438155.1 hypothetical protein PPL_01284 [Heterostelium album PN500]